MILKKFNCENARRAEKIILARGLGKSFMPLRGFIFNETPDGFVWDFGGDSRKFFVS